MIFRTYSSGASGRSRLDQRGQAAASAVCTRSSALGQSPVSSQPDRNSADERASTKSRNPSGSAGRVTPGSVSTDPPLWLIGLTSIRGASRPERFTRGAYPGLVPLAAAATRPGTTGAWPPPGPGAPAPARLPVGGPYLRAAAPPRLRFGRPRPL